VKTAVLPSQTSFVACGGKTTPLIHAFPTHANSIAAGYEKSIPALKINILWGMATSIPHLVPTQFRESIFPSHKPSKNTGSGVGKRSLLVQGWTGSLLRPNLKKKNMVYMGPYAGVDYNSIVCPLQSRLQYLYHGQPYALINLLNPMPESTLSHSQGLRIWPLHWYTHTIRYSSTIALRRSCKFELLFEMEYMFRL
jgi:hypothetical protein